MITFLSVIALLGLVAFVIGGIMWFAARNDNRTTTGPGSYTERVRTAITLMVGGGVVWAIVTIILGIIALVDAWT